MGNADRVWTDGKPLDRIQSKSYNRCSHGFDWENRTQREGSVCHAGNSCRWAPRRQETANAANGARETRCMHRNDIRTSLQSLSARIEHEFQAGIEGFFGSRARGDDREDSDLDVLVRFGEEATLYDLVGLGDFLESVFNCKVDIVSTRAIPEELGPRIYKDLVKV